MSLILTAGGAHREAEEGTQEQSRISDRKKTEQNRAVQQYGVVISRRPSDMISNREQQQRYRFSGSTNDQIVRYREREGLIYHE